MGVRGIGWQAKMPLEDGLRKAYDCLKANVE